MMSADQSKCMIWIDVIAQNLKAIDKYSFVRFQNLVGILIIVFAKDSICPRISKLDTDVVKTGLAGTVGNKGGCIVKFNIDDSSFVFTNVHLEAGGKANKERLANISDIHARAFQQGSLGKKREERIMSLDYKFFFGDTNFRINHGYTEVKMIIEEYEKLLAEGKLGEAGDRFESLLACDQLGQTKDQNEYLRKYTEYPINFLPTYKYDPNSTIYDTSKKQRTPSWTDRILWASETGVKQRFYSRREYLESDHRPVVGYFIVPVKKIDKSKREAVIKSLYAEGFTVINHSKSLEQFNIKPQEILEIKEEVKPEAQPQEKAESLDQDTNVTITDSQVQS